MGKTIDDFIKEGHSAFPYFAGDYSSAGMTLRDYFAARVDISAYTPFENLKAILGRLPTVGEMAEYIAGLRYIEADRMLVERAK